MDIRLLVAFAGAAAALWAVVRWRQAIQVVMVILVVEGAIRKWLFPGAQDLVYLGKDVILLGAYAGFLRQRGQLRYRPPALPALYSALGAAVVFGLLEIFNPNLPNLLVGIFGFKAYFLYVPLLFVVPAAFSTDRDLVLFLRRYILFSIPVGLLAVAQFFSPASSALNTYARTGDVAGADISTFGSSQFVRVTATFSYITGYGSYLVAITILILSFLAATRWRLRASLPAYVALGMALIGMLMTGSRGPVLMLALLFPVYWWLAVIRGREGGATFARLLLGLTLLGVLIGSFGSQAVAAFRGRAAGTEDVMPRLLIPFSAPFDAVGPAGPFGYGIGATHQTAAAVTSGIAPYSWLGGNAVEAESGQVMLELGPIGFLLFYFVRFFLAGFALLQVFRLRTQFHRALATACLLFFLAQIPGNIVFDNTSDLFFWFFAGLLMLVMRLDRVAVWKAAQAARDAAGTAAAERVAPEPPPRRRLLPEVAGGPPSGSRWR